MISAPTCPVSVSDIKPTHNPLHKTVKSAGFQHFDYYLPPLLKEHIQSCRLRMAMDMVCPHIPLVAASFLTLNKLFFQFSSHTKTQLPIRLIFEIKVPLQASLS